MISKLLYFESRYYNLSRKLPSILNIPEIKHSYSTTSLTQSDKSLSRHGKRSGPTPSFGAKAKEATKMTYYSAVVVAGVGALCLMMYTIYKELISTYSPQTVYSSAVKRLSSEPEIVKVFGDVQKCFGESLRRGRRQHVSHLAYEMDGKKGFRMKFYMQGQFRAGTAHLDVIQSSTGWEYRYLFVQSDSYPYQVVVVEDNRGVLDGKLSEPHFSSASDSLPSLPPLKNS